MTQILIARVGGLLIPACSFLGPLIPKFEESRATERYEGHTKIWSEQSRAPQ
jgi:hypothetical protein